MKYLDYINTKLSNMSESELQNFSEQQNFGIGSAILRGLKSSKGAIKGGKSPINAFKKGAGRQIEADKATKEMWEGFAGPGTARKLESLGKTNPITPIRFKKKDFINRSANVVKDSRIGTKLEPLPPKAIPVENTIAGKAVANEAKAVENGASKVAENTSKEVAKAETKAVESTASNVAKEGEEVMTRFGSPSEAIASNKTIQALDQKILKAVKEGNTKKAAELRKARSKKARDIELAFHKAYSGKLRNIHEWGRDHKLVSGTLGAAGALGAGAVAATGAGAIWGANKVTDAIFD